MEDFLNQLVAFVKKNRDLTVTIRSLAAGGWFTIFVCDDEDEHIIDFDVRSLGEHELAGRKIKMCEVRHETFGYLVVQQSSHVLAGLIPV